MWSSQNKLKKDVYYWTPNLPAMGNEVFVLAPNARKLSTWESLARTSAAARLGEDKCNSVILCRIILNHLNKKFSSDITCFNIF